jgi:DNA-binding SARP family transcriptional activator
VLETRPGGYRLRLAPEDLDAARFEALLERGRALLAAGEPGGALGVLQEALGLWRGPPLMEFRFQDFALNEIGRLDELRLLALEHRLEAEIGLGNHAKAIPDLQILVRDQPLREMPQRLLMLALYRAGRQADALALYKDARAALRDGLALEPSGGLQALEAAILVHDPALDLPTSVGTVLPGAQLRAEAGRVRLPPPAAGHFAAGRRFLLWQRPSRWSRSASSPSCLAKALAQARPACPSTPSDLSTATGIG